MRKFKQVLSLVLAVAMLVGLMPIMTITSSAAFNDTTLKFDSDGSFTIMQLTDIQDDEEVDETTLALITKAVDRYSPDLVVLTGDNIAGKMTESEFQSSADQFLAPIINKGIRYAVTFGNHDSESNTLNTSIGRQEQYDYYVSKSSLAVDFDEYSLNGVGTGMIPIYTYDEKNVAFGVFIADSGDYDDNGDYDHVEADQIAWYQSESARLATLSKDGNVVPTLSFQHIPMPEIYDTLLTQVSSTDAGAIRGTGNWSNNYYILDPNNSTIVGEMNEGPCPSAINAGQYQGILSVGNSVGVFYGHDHTNTFMGTDSNGITQGYSKAATLHSYNNGDPGIRIFNVNVDGTYTTTQHTYSSMQVEEDKEFERDVIAGTLSVPEKLYVGASDNSLSKQELGSTIQLQSLNHKTQAMYNNDLTVSIDLGNNSTDVTLTPQSGINVGSVVTTVKDSSTNTYTWQITGGTASAGTAAEFKVSYTVEGNTFSQYAYSYVDDIATPAGHYVFTRNYRGNNSEDNWNSQTYVMAVLGDTVYGDARTNTENVSYSDNNGTVGGYTTATAGYYNYLGSSDGGFIGMSDLRYGMNFFSPSRARLFPNFVRFAAAGLSPVATVYADTSLYSTIGDLGVYVNYWRHSVTDHSLETTMKLYFKIGDVSYTSSDYTSNLAGSTSISSSASSVALAAARGSNAGFTITGQIPVDGTQYTMISHGYSYWNENYDTPHNTFLPVLISFVTYDKAELRALVNAERTAMRQTDSVTYRAAFKEAYKVVQKTNTTQTEIDSALIMLNAAVEALTFTGTNVSSNAAQAGTTTIPPVVYIAGSGYGIGAQPTGNILQPGVVNYDSQALDASGSFSFSVPQGASNATVSVTTQNGGSVEYTWDAANGVGQITGGTAYANDYLYYTFTYTLNGKTYTQVEASAVLEAPQGSGWLTFVIRDKWTAGNWNKRQSAVEGNMFFGTKGSVAGTYFTSTGGTTGGPGTTPSDAGLTSTYYGINFNNVVDAYSQGVAGIGMLNWLRGSDGDDMFNNDTYWCGTTGENNSDGGYRATFKMVVDTSLVSDMSQTGVFFKGINFNNSTGVYDANQTASQFYSGNSLSTTTSALTLATAVRNDGGSGNGYGTSAGHWFRRDLTGSLPTAGNYTYYAKFNTSHPDMDKDINTIFIWNFDISYVNKASARDILAQEAEYNRQLFDGYSDANGKFTAYLNALAKVKAYAGNVMISDADTQTAVNELNTAIAQLEYLPADYTAVTAKVNEVRVQHADNSYSYRPNPDNDPTYYVTGLYYPWNNFSSTNEVDIPIDNINWNLDIRYQATVDGYVDAIDIGWNNVMLASADYTVVDRYLGYKTGTGANGAAGGSGILLPQKYAYLMNKEFVDATCYTTESYQAWTDACAAGQSNRTLKAPDQAQVDTYAANLEAAYEALTLNSADYSVLDEVIGEINQNINETVEVVDPANSANNFTIPYYDPDYTALLTAKMAERVDGLTILEQEDVDALVIELEDLYAKLGENLNDADYTFANREKATEATYEAEYEKYYTTASWQALVDARAAIKSGRLSGEQTQVNAWAKAIYDARNALVYNGADYSVVAEYTAKYADLLPNADWYNGWASFEAAYTAVVYGLDITQQATVDTYAANLKTAYEALTLKDADYSYLKTTIGVAKAKTDYESFYTEGSYKTFYEEYTKALEFSAKDPLKINEQATVDGYTDALNAAIEQLQWKPVDMEPVNTAVEAFNNLNVYNESYLEEGYADADGNGLADIWEAVQAAYDAAEALQNKEDELDIRNNSEVIAAANTLNTEAAKLPALYYAVDAAIAEIPEDLSVYTTESVANLNAVVASINRDYKIGNQAIVDEYEIKVWEAIDALELAAVSLVAAEGSTTIIDAERGFIYGLVDGDVEEITDLIAGGWAEIVGNGRLEYTLVGENTNLGTGAKVELINNNTDAVVETYYIVIFGDNDGDGYITLEDATDLRKYTAILDCKYEYEDLTLPQVFAMDINADGYVDLSDDYYVVAYASVLYDTIKQTYQGQA